MKKALTLCLALVFIFVMAAFPASAATKDLYVKDGGTGDGSQASPFGTLEDAYAAAAALTDDVVIHLDGVTTAETGNFTAPAHTNAITLTGTLKDAHTVDWFFISGGPLTLKNLTIEAGAKSVFFLAGVNPFTVDEGVVTTLAKASIYGVGSASTDITAGDVNITVKSGAFTDVAIFRQGAPNNIDGNGKITVSGTAEINNLVVARNSWKTINNAEFILEGGKVNRFAGNCDRVAKDMLGEKKTGVSGKFTLTVKSGFDFANSFNEKNTGTFFGISGSTVATSGKDALSVAEYVLVLDEAIYDTVKNDADKCQADSFDSIEKLAAGTTPTNPTPTNPTPTNPTPTNPTPSTPATGSTTVIVAAAAVCSILGAAYLLAKKKENA